MNKQQMKDRNARWGIIGEVDNDGWLAQLIDVTKSYHNDNLVMASEIGINWLDAQPEARVPGVVELAKVALNQRRTGTVGGIGSRELAHAERALHRVFNTLTPEQQSEAKAAFNVLAGRAAQQWPESNFNKPPENAARISQVPDQGCESGRARRCEPHKLKQKHTKHEQTKVREQLSTIEGARKFLTDLFLASRAEGSFNIQAVFVCDKPAAAILLTGSREDDAEAIHQMATETKAEAVVLAVDGSANKPTSKVRPSQDPNRTEAFLLFTILPDGTFTGKYKPYRMVNGHVEWIKSRNDVYARPRVPFIPWKAAA